MLNFIFYVDLIANFITAYENEDKNVEFRLKKIALNYVQSWFFLDLIACVPINLIIDLVKPTLAEDGEGNDQSMKLLRLARLPRLYRLVRLIRLIRLLKMGDSFKKLFNSLHINQGIAKLVGVIFIILFLNHFVACLWYWLAEFLQPTDGQEDNDYWVVRQELEDDTDGMKYVVAIYWAFQTLTTVGYGDISATRDYERLIALIWIILGCGFYSYTIGNL